MRFETKAAIAALTFLTLTSCAGRDDNVASASTSPDARGMAVQDFPVKLGEPFTVGGATYTPEDIPNYDEVGYASWYGAERAGQPTANGETFVASAVSGAHKTLPLPSYVEVTALDSGRTILVRINDRGPFANDRLIDLSEGAARQLGIGPEGLAAVRVRRVNPPEQERSVLRSGLPATTRMDTPESLLKVLRDRLAKQPKPASQPRKGPAAVAAGPAAVEARNAASGTRYVREGAAIRQPAEKTGQPVAKEAMFSVQVGAFASRASADSLAARSGAKVATSTDGRLFRVRLGPFASSAEAEAALADVRKRGYPQARIVRD